MRPSLRLRSTALYASALPRRAGLCAWAFLVLAALFLGGAFAATARAQVIETVAGGFNPLSASPSEDFCAPIRALATHGTDVYLMSCDRIIKVSGGTTTVVAGNGITGFSGDGGPATSASLGRPLGLALDAAGDLFIQDGLNARIREVLATAQNGHNAGDIITIAGTGVPGFSGDGGPATAAQISSNLGGLVTDAAGNVFFSDTGNVVVREIIAAGANAGNIVTVAGTGAFCRPAGSACGDGAPATAAKLHTPRGIYVDSSEDIFIADHGDSKIREVVGGPGGNIITVAGTGAFGFSGDGGPATNATLSLPFDVVGDGSGNVYIADNFNNRIRKFTVGGNITTVAGNGAAFPGSCATSLDSCVGNGGSPTAAIVSSPEKVRFDSNGNLFILSGNTVQVQEATGLGSPNPSIQTFASNGAYGFHDNVPATNGQFLGIIDAVTDKAGNIFVSDQFAGSIREVVAATGFIETVAGGGQQLVVCSPNSPTCSPIGDGGLALGAVMSPEGLFVDSSGNIYEADDFGEVRRFTVGGNIESVAGSYAQAVAGNTPSGDGGPATSAGICDPVGVALDAAGNIFISDFCNRNVREVNRAGIISTIAGDPTGANFCVQFPTGCGDGGPATAALLNGPSGLYVDRSDDVFIVDFSNHVVREIVNPGPSGFIQAVAGNGTAGFSGDGGPAASAHLNSPEFIHADTHGNLYVGDFGNNLIRVFRVGGNINTIVGDRTMGFSGDGGAPLNAELNNPEDAAIDPSGRLVIADISNARIRRVTLKQSTTTLTVSSSPNPPVANQPLTLTATVTTDPATLTGTVTFSASGTATGDQLIPIGEATLTQGVATLVIPGAPQPGTYVLAADYSGDANVAVAGSTSAPVTEVVGGNSTTTSLMSSQNPSKVGQLQGVTFTATVTSSGTAKPTGTVIFTDNGTPIGTPVSLSGGVATVTDTTLTVGPHSIGADYTGALGFGTSRAKLGQEVDSTGTAATTTALTSAPDPSVVGQTITFTATVTNTSTIAGTPTGTVAFIAVNPALFGSKLIGTAPLVSGTATFITQPVPISGTASVTATYFGDPAFAASTSTALIQTVHAGTAATTTTLTSSLNPSVVGQTVTFAAVVSSSGGNPSGLVIFFDGTTAISSVSISGGAPAKLTTALAPGSHVITVQYGGSATFAASTSNAVTQIVNNKAATTTTITSLPNPSNAGQAVTFTATVRGSGSAIPTGIVVFVDTFGSGEGPIGEATLNGSGQATLTVSSLAVGKHAVFASYAGDTSSQSGNSAPVTQTVVNLTTTRLTGPPTTLVGLPASFTAFVTSTGGTPTGTVTFTNNGNPMGSVPLDGDGIASLTVTFAHAGKHVIVATYLANGTFGGSSATLTESVKPATTITTLFSSLNPALVGQSVTFTATVFSAGASTTSITPAGTVSFTNNGAAMGSATLNASGVATITASFGLATTHSIVATYSGNVSFLGSASTKFPQVVSPPASTSTTLTSSPNPSLVGEPVKFTATVTSASGIPAGTVSFTNNGVAMGSATLNASGVATITASFGLATTHFIVATYSGNVSFLGSASTKFAQVVSPKAPTTTTLTSSVNPSVIGQSVMFTASVTSASGIPAGTVSFTNNGVAMGSATLNASGVATITASFGLATTHFIVATYSGNVSFLGSASTKFAQVVNPKAPTTTTLTSSVNPSVIGQSVMFTATVTSPSGIPER